MSLTQIDGKSVRFLNAVRYCGGEANISEIRALTGLNRNETNYRFRKLQELDLIDVGYEESKGDLPARKVAILTGAARRELEQGVDSSTTGLVISDEPDAEEVSRERFIALEEQMQEMRQAHQAAAWDARHNEGVPREEFESLREYVHEWTEFAERYFLAIRRVLERFLPGVDDFDDHLREAEK